MYFFRMTCFILLLQIVVKISYSIRAYVTRFIQNTSTNLLGLPELHDTLRQTRAAWMFAFRLAGLGHPLKHVLGYRERITLLLVILFTSKYKLQLIKTPPAAWNINEVRSNLAPLLSPLHIASVLTFIEWVLFISYVSRINCDVVLLYSVQFLITFMLAG